MSKIRGLQRHLHTIGSSVLFQRIILICTIFCFKFYSLILFMFHPVYRSPLPRPTLSNPFLLNCASLQKVKSTLGMTSPLEIQSQQNQAHTLPMRPNLAGDLHLNLLGKSLGTFQNNYQWVGTDKCYCSSLETAVDHCLCPTAGSGAASDGKAVSDWMLQALFLFSVTELLGLVWNCPVLGIRVLWLVS